jgi:hypothetical protein
MPLILCGNRYGRRGSSPHSPGHPRRRRSNPSPCSNPHFSATPRQEATIPVPRSCRRLREPLIDQTRIRIVCSGGRIVYGQASAVPLQVPQCVLHRGRGVDLTSKHVFASESLQLLTSRGSVPQSNSLSSADDLTLQEPGIIQTNTEGKPTIGGCDIFNSMLLKD